MQQLIRLIQGLDNQFVEATLIDLAQNHVDDFESLWWVQLRSFSQEDKYWDWVFKQRLSTSNENFESYAIECEGRTQGLMMLETQWHRSQVTIGRRLVYVEALTTAPWNREAVRRPPELKGVGTALLLFARQRSLELGYEGRVGLHSLPGAEGFYERRSMANYGADPDKENLTYFEYAPLQQLR